jgi:hypothetical protein
MQQNGEIESWQAVQIATFERIQWLNMLTRLFTCVIHRLLMGLWTSLFSISCFRGAEKGCASVGYVRGKLTFPCDSSCESNPMPTPQILGAIVGRSPSASPAFAHGKYRIRQNNCTTEHHAGNQGVEMSQSLCQRHRQAAFVHQRMRGMDFKNTLSRASQQLRPQSSP